MFKCLNVYMFKCLNALPMHWLKNKYQNLVKSLSPKRVLVFLLTFGFVVYANSLINSMFWDDYDSVINNQFVHSWQYFPQYFSENLTAGAGIKDNYWRPLLLVSFAVDYSVGGLEPFFYHFQNLFWHLAATLLVFLLGHKLSQNLLASFLASLLFLVHPLQTEAVTYVAGRADPMHTALMLGSFLLWLNYLNLKNKKLLLGSLLLFSFALLTKERAIILPFLLTIFIFLAPPVEQTLKNWKQKLFPLLPFFSITFIYILLRLTILHFSATFDLGAQTILQSTTLWQKILVFLAGLGTYAQLILWPVKLYMEKTLPIPTSLFEPMVLFGLAVLGVTIFFIQYFWRKQSLPAFCLLAFFATLLPSMHIYPIQGLLYEHWLYPAFPWLFLAFGLWFSKYLNPECKTTKFPPVYFALGFLFVILAFSVRTMLRNQDWQTPVKFYETNIALGGVSGRVYTNLGMAYDEAKQSDQAIAAYQNAIKISNNQLFQPWYDLGNTFSQQGKTTEALEAYQQAIKINPYFPASYLNSAKIQLDQKNFSQALAILKDAETANPNQIGILSAIATIAFNSHDPATAKAYAQKILTLDPSNQQAKELLRR